MKKKITSITKAVTTSAFFAVLLFSSCSKNELEDLQNPNATASLPIATAKNDVSAMDLAVPVPADAMISISHGACLGACPVYQISISKSGDVVYTGLHNVHVTGTVRFKISAEAAYELGYRMEQGGFFGFKDSYPIIPDAPQTVTSLIWNNKVKTVIDCGVNIPEELSAMRTTIENSLHIDRFLNSETVAQSGTEIPQ
jgi:hypothetical protein